MLRILTDYERGYLEATIDDEGTLTLRKFKNEVPAKRKHAQTHLFKPLAYVSNTSLDLLRYIQSMIGSGSIYVHDYSPPENHKPSYKYIFPLGILRDILPQLHFVVKKRQKEIVLRALEIAKRHRGGVIASIEETTELNELVDEIRRLNNRGINNVYSVEHFPLLEDPEEHAKVVADPVSLTKKEEKTGLDAFF